MHSITGEMRSRFVDSKKESPTALAPVPDPAPAVQEGKGSFDQHERRMSLKTDSHEDCSLTSAFSSVVSHNSGNTQERPVLGISSRPTSPMDPYNSSKNQYETKSKEAFDPIVPFDEEIDTLASNRSQSDSLRPFPHLHVKPQQQRFMKQRNRSK